jgi:hypothetical protein
MVRSLPPFVSIVDLIVIKALAIERLVVPQALLISAFTEASTAREWMLNIG